MYAHKNRCDDRCRIASARLAIRQILRIDFCGQGCYSSIDTVALSIIGFGDCNNKLAMHRLIAASRQKA